MKKIAVMLAVFILAFAAVGCGKSSNTSNSGSAAARNDSSSESRTGSAAKDQTSSSGGKVNAPQATPGSASQSNSNPTVVAKSNNAVSNEDKEKILKELDKELDSLFSSINSIEELEDSDLQLSN